MRIENSTPTNTAAKAVASTNPASKREARKAACNRGRSISPAAVTNSIPASAAVGMNFASGTSKTMLRATVAPAKTPDIRLTAPA